MGEMKITIMRNGPYHVEGGVPLKERIIKPKEHVFVWEDGRTFDAGEDYFLCRCGNSQTAPFCDGAHVSAHFDGELSASRADYADRAELQRGPGVDLLDDNRCAFARFCHADHGMVWNLVNVSDNANMKAEAIASAQACPAGRLVPLEKDGTVLEPDLPAEIIVVQDPAQGASGGLYVTGNIKIVDEDGREFEPRSRVMLCRCGESSNKPFCDATHVPIHFKDS